MPLDSILSGATIPDGPSDPARIAGDPRRAGVAIGVTPKTRLRARWESRGARLQALGFADYDAYLRSSAWAATKARYRESDRPQDCICGATEHLQMHHVTYERVGGDELLSDLTPLCPTCHTMIHALEAAGEMGLDPASMANPERAFVYRLEQRRRASEIFDPITAAIERERMPDRMRQETKRINRLLGETVRETVRKGYDLTDFFRHLWDLLAVAQAELNCRVETGATWTLRYQKERYSRVRPFSLITHAEAREQRRAAALPTEEARHIIVRVQVPPREPAGPYPPGRRCAHPSCIAVLRTTNPGPCCSAHEAAFAVELASRERAAA